MLRVEELLALKLILEFSVRMSEPAALSIDPLLDWLTILMEISINKIKLIKIWL